MKEQCKQISMPKTHGPRAQGHENDTRQLCNPIMAIETLTLFGKKKKHKPWSRMLVVRENCARSFWGPSKSVPLTSNKYLLNSNRVQKTNF